MKKETLLVAAFFACSSPTRAKSPPLTGAIPFNFQSGVCPVNALSCASSISQPEWCCPSDGRCVFGNGGIVACCEYSINCEGEQSNAGGQEPDPNPDPVSPSVASADATTVMPGGVAMVTVSPSSSVVITDANESWGVRDQKGSHVAWVGVLLALAWVLRG